MGRIVIETDDETGETTVDFTMSNGQRVKFASDTSSSEFRHVRPEPDRIDVSGADGTYQYITGPQEPAYWKLTIVVDNIPKIEAFTTEE